MKKFKRVFCVLLLLIMLFTMLSCGSATETDNNTEAADTSSEEVQPTVPEQFAEKAEYINAATDRKTTVSARYDKKTGDAEYIEEYEYTIEYVGIGTESFAARVSTKTILDKSVIRSTEIYRDGEAIYEVNGDEMYYSAQMTAEEYQSRHIPAVILDPVNYQTVTYDADKMEFSFSDAQSHESWMAPEHAKLTSAEGRATLSSDGEISEMYYEADYVQGAVTVSAQYTVTLGECTLSADSIEGPASTKKMEIDDIDTAIAIKYAYVMLDAGFNTNGTRTEYAYSQAAGVEYSGSDTFASYGKGADAMAILSMTGSYRNTMGASTEYEYEFLHKDGTMTVTVDGGEPEASDVTLSEQLDMIHDALKANVYDMRDMFSISTGHLPDYLIVNFDLPTEYGDIIEDEVNVTLFGEADYLDSYSASYTTSELTAYMCIDKDTGFMVASGIEYTGVHSINGQLCQLVYTSNSTNEMADPAAYTTITGDPVPDVEPEQKATPLFYKVTSPEGNTMYLLGTIHVGDDRTAYLPDEILEALEASDALALEVVVDTLEQRIMEDPVLLSAYVKGYMYSGGKTNETVLPAELYELFQHAEKILGDTTYNERLYPSVVSSAIQYHLFETSNRLYEDKGVDRRLLAIAREKGMEVLDVEDIYERVQIDSRYSELIHELMIESALTSTRAELIDQTVEMYEIWCRGDKDEFKNYLAKESELEKDEMTEEELAAAEEYDRILITERDAQMIERAKEYLASDKTVFVAVGAMHVIGEGAMVDSLEAAGYTVELVEYK